MNNQLPAEELLIKAAADLSGHDPGELDAREALHILQEYGREPMGDLYRQLTDAATAEYFSDPTHSAEWEELAKEFEGDYPDLVALTLQRDLSPAVKEKARAMYDDLPQDDPQRDELEKIINEPALSPEIQEAAESVNRVTNNIAETMRPFAVDIKGIQDAIAPALDTARGVAKVILATQEAIRAAMAPIDFSGLFEQYDKAREAISELVDNNPEFVLYDEINGDLLPYMTEELKKPQYGGKTIAELWEEAQESDGGLFSEDTRLMQAVNAARAAKAQDDTIAAQNAGRALRRQTRENAAQKGAIMELRNDGTLPVFSEKTLWNAFAPGRIAQMGKLAPDAINKKTGRVEKIELEKGDILPLPAANISYKAFMLLNAITANSVENYREYLVSGGAIRFYVKGVLDQLEVDARIHGDPQQIELDPQQIELDRYTRNRKTTGALYLEEQLKPLLLFVGTTPDGSRYSVLNYEGYDIESDTMTIRSPYLFQLWKATQTAFAERKKGKEQRIADGKKPLKADLKPLELNTLFKRSAYKEDDTVLEIATFITNVLLNAGKGAHKTKIKYRTLINNCPRLRERLVEIENQPKETDGKKINKTAHYNSVLRKIARAYTLIMTPDKCDALKHFEFIEFSPTKEKGGQREFVPPTKSTLDGEIYINWRRIDPDDD